MRRLSLAAAGLLVASEAFAISRYDPTGMACATVQAIIVTEGAVILRYKSSSVLGLPVYDRFVRSRQYCSSGEVIRGAGVPTADSKYCPVKKCVESDIFVDN